MNEKHVIDPGWEWARNFRISQGVRIGNTIYVSGQVAYGEDGEIIGRGDMGAQARQAFRNIRTIIEAGGGAMSDVVKITAYVTDMDRYAEFAAARAEAFADTEPPASATVAIPVLVDPDLLVEVDAIAYISGQGG